MKRYGAHVSVILTGIALLISTSCSKPSELQIQNIDISNITETSAQLSWSVDGDEYSSTLINIYEETGNAESGTTISIAGNSETSALLDGLRGLTKYVYSIVLLNDNSEELGNTGERTFKTTYTREAFEMFTADSVTLRGHFTYFSSRQSKVPGIILMHGLGAVMGTWHNSETLEMLISEGYACMAFFFRGHGNSDAVEDLQTFKSFEGIGWLGNDIETAITYMSDHTLIEPMQIGLIGGSMGGMASVFGNLHPEVQTSVALSPTDVLANYKSMFPEVGKNNLASIYYIVGEDDRLSDWDFLGDAKRLYSSTDEPRKLWILPGSTLHGAQVMTYPGAMDSVRNWFLEHLPSPYSN